MITTLIEEGQKPLRNRVVQKLLEQYNKDKEEPILLIESIAHTCFSGDYVYTFFKAIGDMPNHYERGETLSVRATITYLTQ